MSIQIFTMCPPQISRAVREIDPTIRELAYMSPNGEGSANQWRRSDVKPYGHFLRLMEQYDRPEGLVINCEPNGEWTNRLVSDICSAAVEELCIPRVGIFAQHHETPESATLLVPRMYPHPAKADGIARTNIEAAKSNLTIQRVIAAATCPYVMEEDADGQSRVARLATPNDWGGDPRRNLPSVLDQLRKFEVVVIWSPVYGGTDPQDVVNLASTLRASNG